MVRSVSTITVVLVLCGGALAEDFTGRSLEEGVAMSRIILVGKITKAAGTFKENGTTFKKFEVKVGEVRRSHAPVGKTGETITVFGENDQKTDQDAVLFLSSKKRNGHRLLFVAKKADLATITKLLALQGSPAKALDGKDRLLAAFFHAHNLRPALLAAAEDKGVKAAAPVAAKDKDKLLSILAWAMEESNKKGAQADVSRRAELLRKVLCGPGGLTEYNTRQKRLAQFFAARFKHPEIRKKQALTTLAMTAKPPAAAKPKNVVAVPVNALRAQVLVARLGATYRRPAPTKKPPKPKINAPSETLLGKAVNGLELGFRTEKAVYDLKENPDQDIQVAAVFRNAGKRAVLFNTYMVFPVLAEVYVVDPSGKLFLYSNKKRLEAAEIPAMGTWSFRELKPGETITFRESIPAGRFVRNGEYKLCVIYKNSYGNEFDVRNAWTGEVVSPRIPVRIVRHEAAPAPKPKTTSKPAKRVPPKRVTPIRRLPVRGQGAVLRKKVQIQVQALNGVIQKRIIIEEVKKK